MTLSPVFGEEEREALRSWLVELARADDRVVAAASLGSAARGELDRWSDIDLALRLAPGVGLDAVVGEWTARVAQTRPVVDHLDVRSSGAHYRVLLLASTLQLDLSFWPHDRPLAGGAPVAVLFGEFPVAPVPAADGSERSRSAVRTGWLYALHVRSALRRGRWWQAAWMLQSLREVVVGLCCRRLVLPTGEGRGVDRLPADLLAALAATHAGRIEPEQLWTSFGDLVDLLLEEAERHGAEVSEGLARVLVELTRPEDAPSS